MFGPHTLKQFHVSAPIVKGQLLIITGHLVFHAGRLVLRVDLPLLLLQDFRGCQHSAIKSFQFSFASSTLAKRKSSVKSRIGRWAARLGRLICVLLEL